MLNRSNNSGLSLMVSESLSKTDNADERVDHSAPSLAGMLMLTGVAYALPFAIYPATHSFNGPTSPEILNLYFIVAWMGIAHFIYAYYGQGKALAKNRKMLFPFAALVLAGAGVLIALRHFAGYMIFSFLMWIYFLPHFVKAEVHFTSALDKSPTTAKAGVFLFPAIAFSFFTFALFGPESLISNRWNLIGGAVATLAVGFAMGLKNQLEDRQLSKYGLLAIFLIAEGLVWATYRKYMVFQFQQGIYVFHIAMASFYHYLRSYDFAWRMGISRGQPSKKGFLPGVVGVNLAVLGIGFMLVNYLPKAPSKYLFDVSYFTFWVGLHQYASDCFNWLRRRIQ